MSIDLDNAKKAVARLSGDDLDALCSYAASLRSLGGAPAREAVETRGPANDAEWVLFELAHVMQYIGVDMSSASQLKRGNNYRAFKNKVPKIMVFLSRVGNKNKQRALLRVGIDLLNENITDMGLAVSSRTIMQHIHRVPSVIDRAFPGYARCGLLHLILRPAPKGK